jgi:hypothetical protein
LLRESQVEINGQYARRVGTSPAARRGESLIACDQPACGEKVEIPPLAGIVPA